eukprot:m.126227 g.126227  ORF g.126227 m.126227 type:complete len:141 (-) comp29189_c0_seq2:67-489(-)
MLVHTAERSAPFLEQSLESVPFLDVQRFRESTAGLELALTMEILLDTIKTKIEKMNALRFSPDFNQATHIMDQFAEEAHALKSGTCQLGCDRLALLCMKMEIFGKSGPLQNSQLLAQLYDTQMESMIAGTMGAVQQLAHQ